MMASSHRNLCTKAPLHWLPAMLCALWLLAWCGLAHGASIPFGSRTVDITAREQPIGAFLQDLFGAVGVPVSVSPTLNSAVNGHFQGAADKVYRNIAKAFNLVEYYDGSVVHVYSAQDMMTRTLPAAGATSTRAMLTIGELGLADDRNKVRLTSEGTMVATGTKRFIEMIEELVRVQAADQKAALPPSGFKVFYLRYAWAQDVTMNLGGRQVLLPGVASTVRALMAGSPRSQVVTTSLELPSSNTVPGMRNGKAGRQGTLGVPGADSTQPSAPALAVAYGGSAPPGMTSAGAPAAQAMQQVMNPGDARLVRVEADARLNAVIVRDSPDRMPQYEELIAALDVEPQAVEIEATIIDLNTEKLRELGVNWRYTKGQGSLLFGKGDGSDLQLTPTTPVGSITPMGQGGFVSAVLGNAGQFIARINALQDQGVAKVVSSPQVLTLSNVEAVFDNSQTFYVKVGGYQDVDLFNVSAGTQLRVTP
ncbi:MAG TPA: secretin N-terminal domain-containing protein, partial [Burkholderiaceae bacterium]|nr:secretin N-terminal domain-containing protein [Burkholderiaceae bacterium]